MILPVPDDDRRPAVTLPVRRGRPLPGKEGRTPAAAAVCPTGWDCSCAASAAQLPDIIRVVLTAGLPKCLLQKVPLSNNEY